MHEIKEESQVWMQELSQMIVFLTDSFANVQESLDQYVLETKTDTKFHL